MQYYKRYQRSYHKYKLIQNKFLFTIDSLFNFIKMIKVFKINERRNLLKIFFQLILC